MVSGVWRSGLLAVSPDAGGVCGPAAGRGPAASGVSRSSRRSGSFVAFSGAAASSAGGGLVAFRALRRSRRPGFSGAGLVSGTAFASGAGSDAGSGTVRGAAASRS
ncbi:hypothetical protein GCM10009678_04490 [Actinomadura kijaniata]